MSSDAHAPTPQHKAIQPCPVRVPLVNEPLGIVQSLVAARENVLGIIPEAAVRDRIVSGRTGTRWHMIMDPDAIRHVLLDRINDYPKSEVTKNLLKPAIGESLFIAEGQHWRWQRRAAAPAFSHRNVSNLAPIMSEAAERSIERIERAGLRAVNMLDEMIAATFEVISDVTFSGASAFDRHVVSKAIDHYVSEVGKISLLDVLGAPDWVPRPARLMSGSALNDVKSVADRAVEARLSEGGRTIPDLLDLLLEGEDPQSQRRMSTTEVRDNLLTFIVAGHETTALTLAWALYLLAFDQTAQETARAEAKSVLQGRIASGTDIKHLKYVRQVIDETLRLYPPAGIVSRTARGHDQLCGRTIRPGDTVMIPIYAIGRHRAHWDEPDAFRPERFAERKAIDRYTYLPFGDGPRICIGASFALQEATIILATLLSRFRFTPVPGRDPKPVMILTLRPEGGVWLMTEPV